MRKILIGVVLAGFCAAVQPAFSQQGPGEGDLELNVFFGGAWHSQNRFEISFPQSSPQEYKEFKLQTALSGGVRFNVFNSGHWGEEFSYGYESNETRFISIFPSGPEQNLPIQIHQFGTNFLYYFDADEEMTVRPFLTAGIGATLYRPTDEALAIAHDPARGNMPGFGTSTEFTFNYGWGMKIRAADRFGFRIVQPAAAI